MFDVTRLIEDIRTARRYTEGILEQIEQRDWFRQPAEGVTHVAWQVGHLAVAQQSLALRRVRGERAGDVALLPPNFRGLFGKGSTPILDPSAYPPPQQIRVVFDRVHQQVVEESADWSEALLAEASDTPPHPMFKTKAGSVRWSVQHEFLHAGQIGLLRRFLGASPLW